MYVGGEGNSEHAYSARGQSCKHISVFERSREERFLASYIITKEQRCSDIRSCLCITVLAGILCARLVSLGFERAERFKEM